MSYETTSHLVHSSIVNEFSGLGSFFRSHEVVVLIPGQHLPLMLLGANWTECATTFPRACTPFCRARESTVIAILLISVNIVRGAGDHGYLTATEEKRILQGSDIV